MLKHLGNTWTLFFGLTLGVLLLMVSMRPELQARPGSSDAPGNKIAIAGHVLTWTTGTVLTYRMVRNVREANHRDDAGRPPGDGRPPEPPSA